MPPKNASRNIARPGSFRRTPTPPPLSDSAEQREAERYLIEAAGVALGVHLRKAKVPLPESGWLEIDGMSESPPVLCEAWAHIGVAKRGQQHKLLADAFKLLYASQFYPEARKLLVLADQNAARHLQGTGWMAKALEAFDVTVHVVELPNDLRIRLIAAQRRQYR